MTEDQKITLGTNVDWTDIRPKGKEINCSTLKRDLEDWWEMSRGGKVDFDMEHLGYLFDAYGLEKREPPKSSCGCEGCCNE